jgi:hypothetical protein
MTFGDFLTKIELTKEQYMKYIGISQNGKVLILKRSVAERFVNNYNEEMILAWNANMDIQLALDPYAIITYIVSYVSKDESGMTKFLTEILKKFGNEDKNELLKQLKLAYLTHREMGLSEAVYKAIAGFKLKDSNIACIFVNSGFPENRSVFFRKVSDEKDTDQAFQVNDQNNDDSDAEEVVESDVKPISIEGKTGKYQQTISVHDRYASRPEELDEMCLAQFATSYTQTSRLPKKIEWTDGGTSIEITTQKILNTNKKLPKYIHLNHNFGFMRLRTFPAVLRIHSSKRKEGHEQHYSELLLFCPWRDEIKDFSRGNADECVQKYMNKKADIDKIRSIFFPGEETITLLESGEYQDLDRPSHIYDLLDAQREQENDDDQAEGMVEDPAFESHRYLGNLRDAAENGLDVPKEEAKFKEIVVPSDEEFSFITQRLHSEQLTIVEKVVNYAKDVVKARNNFKVKLDAPRLIVHGGAGMLVD